MVIDSDLVIDEDMEPDPSLNRILDCRLGLLLNFDVKALKNGLRRIAR